ASRVNGSRLIRPSCAPPRPRLSPPELRGGRHDGAGLAELRDGLLNQRSTLACIPRLLRLRDQVPRLGEPRHRVGVDAALVEHADAVLRVSQRGLQAPVLLLLWVTPVREDLPELARRHVDAL